MALSSISARKERCPMTLKSLSPLVLSAMLAICPAVALCTEELEDKHPAKAESHADHDKKEHEEHHHEAPHGGTLVVLGEESAHIEITLDEESGALTAYVLDGEAEKAVALSATSITLAIKVAAKGDVGTTSSKVALKAVANQ